MEFMTCQSWNIKLIEHDLFEHSMSFLRVFLVLETFLVFENKGLADFRSKILLGCYLKRSYDLFLFEGKNLILIWKLHSQLPQNSFIGILSKKRLDLLCQFRSTKTILLFLIWLNLSFFLKFCWCVLWYCCFWHRKSSFLICYVLIFLS